MKRIHLHFILLFLFTLTIASKVLASDGDCECPKILCAEDCEIEQGLSFYSEKCAEGSRIMSCSKPNCVKKENRPQRCELANKNEIPAIPTIEDSSNSPKRMVASEKKHAVGRVKFIEGTVRKTQSSIEGDALLNVGDEIFENDNIETSDESKAKILFYSGNFINMTPNTKVVVSEASDSKDIKKKQKMILDLIKGKVRSKVNRKYSGQNEYFRVRTSAAVAGVRGTDFTVSIEANQLGLVSKVETLSGKVELSDRSLIKKIKVDKGQVASYIVPNEVSKIDKDKSEFVTQGYFSKIESLNAYELKKIDRETTFEIVKNENTVRDVTSKSASVCTQPEGDFNQCAWSCDNNPAGETRCRTDLPRVSCVRRKCDANGRWSQPSHLPASYYESCKANGHVIKTCDY